MHEEVPAEAAGRPQSAWVVGDAWITRIDELVLEGQGRWLIPEATADLVAAQPWIDDSATDEAGEIRVSVHSFVVDIGDTRIVVDTGVGNHKVRENPAWNGLDTEYLERMRSAGFDPMSVDLVVMTHIHRDHVGWNTVLAGSEWTPTFPSARYLVSRREWDYWTSVDLTDDQSAMFVDSIDPVRDSGQLEKVDEMQVAEGVTLVPTPGHTPGHVSVQITSDRQSALITGDLLHHPVQLAHPELCCGVDVDTREADRSRAERLADLTESGALVLGTHFTTPTGGFVRRNADGNGYRLVSSPVMEPEPR